MDYSQMLTQVEDSEINIRVGELFGWNAYFIHPDGSVTFRDDKGRIKGKKNYCNNSADAWQIIVENRISIRNRYEGDWKAENEWGESFFHVACNPLRAAMIVFLMMQESKNANS